MSITTDKMTEISTVKSIDDIPNVVDSQNRTLVIILAVTLPTLACIAVLTSLIICYRRRHTTIWLKKLENSSRLQAIVVNISPTSIQPQCSEKKRCFSHLQPRTETIVYHRLSVPTTPAVYSLFKSPSKGETNAGFDEYLTKKEQQPILKPSSNIRQYITTVQTDFPAFLQVPVRKITTELVETIATHRLSLLSDTSCGSSETLISTNRSNNSRRSGSSSSCSNTSQTILLFSQRTDF